jgi:hypothetical protein
MTRFLRLALLLYLTATGVGLVLRYATAAPLPGLNAAYALHAHSHTLYFGWAALALFTLYFQRVGATDAAVQRVLWTIVGVSVATLLAFLHSGYGLPGVIVSAASLVVWGVAVGLFLRRARGHRAPDLAWLRVSVGYVVAACVGAGARLVLLVTKADPLWGRLAVAFFLTTFAGFFLFGVVGVLAHFLEERGAPLDARLLRWQLGWMTPLTALTFPLGVTGGMDTLLGPLARVAAALLVVPAALWLVNLWSATHQLPVGSRRVLRTIAAAWAVKTVLEAAAAFGLHALAATSRHAVMLQVHLVLLGVVTAALLLVARAHLGRVTGPVLLLHQCGVGVLCLGLLLASLATTAAWPTGTFGLWLALAGGAVVWVVDVALVLEAIDLRRLQARVEHLQT